LVVTPDGVDVVDVAWRFGTQTGNKQKMQPSGLQVHCDLLTSHKL
jgi:hypothetical protein